MKKEQIWLHIGTHKTGTTALQTGLSGYDDGVTRYAQLGNPNHSGALALIYNPASGVHASFARQGVSRLGVGVYGALSRWRLRRELEGPARRLILSGEALCGFKIDAMQRLADDLKRQSTSQRVLVYLRDPISHATSAFQERVRAGLGMLDLLTVPTFRGRLRPSMEVFGREAIEAVAFDRKTLGPGGIVADAARRMGLTLTGEAPVVANESLSGEAVALLYFWNRTPGARVGSVRRNKARQRLHALLAEALPGRFALAPALVQPLIKVKDLEWVQRHFAVDFHAALGHAPGEIEGAVAGEADLERLRRAAVPGLQAHLDTLGQSELPDDPDALMTRAFAHCLAQVSTLELLRRI